MFPAFFQSTFFKAAIFQNFMTVIAEARRFFSVQNKRHPAYHFFIYLFIYLFLKLLKPLLYLNFHFSKEKPEENISIAWFEILQEFFLNFPTHVSFSHPSTKEV